MQTFRLGGGEAMGGRGPGDVASRHAPAARGARRVVSAEHPRTSPTRLSISTASPPAAQSPQGDRGEPVSSLKYHHQWSS